MLDDTDPQPPDHDPSEGPNSLQGGGGAHVARRILRATRCVMSRIGQCPLAKQIDPSSLVGTRASLMHDLAGTNLASVLSNARSATPVICRDASSSSNPRLGTPPRRRRVLRSQGVRTR